MNPRFSLSMVCASLIWCATAHASSAQQTAFAAEVKKAKTTTEGKLHSSLRAITAAPAFSARAIRGGHRPALMPQAASVRVNVVADADHVQQVKAALQSLGLTGAQAAGGMISGSASITALKAMAAVPGVHTIRPSLSRTRAGLVTSQGDVAQRSDVARSKFDVNGHGVTVGVLSDSFGCLTGPLAEGQLFTTTQQDIANGDLPRRTRILEEIADCTPPDEPPAIDEGRAIGQIIHDVAPAASLLFHTAVNSEADFAQGIIDLADAGASIIVDDIGYFDEPMFQDGIVAQAVNAVKRRGVAYFSSAGNSARESYESNFRLSKSYGIDGPRHNFGTSKKIDGLQTLTITDEADEVFVLNWDQPFASAGGKGSRSDVDMIFYDMKGDPLPTCGDPLPPVCQLAGIDPNIGGDALEFAEVVNFSGDDVQVQLSVELFKGPVPRYLKYLWYDLFDGTVIVDEHDTQSGTVYGHPLARGAEAVGAAPWYNTVAWNNPFHKVCVPACLELFSSAGGVPIFFDTRGNRLDSPHVRRKPEITGPDGANSTFFYSPLLDEVPGTSEPDIYPNFFGTSASAPHVAAIAALMQDKYQREHHRSLPPDRIYNILERTAKDMKYRAGRVTPPSKFPFGTAGFDFDSGYGFVDAVAALRAVN